MLVMEEEEERAKGNESNAEWLNEKIEDKNIFSEIIAFLLIINNIIATITSTIITIIAIIQSFISTYRPSSLKVVFPSLTSRHRK